MNTKIETLLDAASMLVKVPNIVSRVTQLCILIEAERPKLFWYAQTPNGNKYYASRQAAKQAGARPICGFVASDAAVQCLNKCWHWLGWTCKAAMIDSVPCELVRSADEPIGYLWRDNKDLINVRIVPNVNSEKLLFMYLARVCGI